MKWILSWECVRHFAVRNAEQTGVSLLTIKNVQPKKDNAVCYRLLNWNYSSCFEDFNVLFYENNKYFLELKKSLFIMRDRQSMNRSFPFYMFEYIFVIYFAAPCRFLLSVFWLSNVTFCKFWISVCDLKSVCRRNLFETRLQWFKQNWTCRRKLLSLHQTGLW